MSASAMGQDMATEVTAAENALTGAETLADVRLLMMTAMATGILDNVDATSGGVDDYGTFAGGVDDYGTFAAPTGNNDFGVF